MTVGQLFLQFVVFRKLLAENWLDKLHCTDHSHYRYVCFFVPFRCGRAREAQTTVEQVLWRQFEKLGSTARSPSFFVFLFRRPCKHVTSHVFAVAPCHSNLPYVNTSTYVTGSCDPFSRSYDITLLVFRIAHASVHICVCNVCPTNGDTILISLFSFALLRCSPARTELMSILGGHKLPENVIDSLLKWKSSWCPHAPSSARGASPTNGRGDAVAATVGYDRCNQVGRTW